MPDNGPRLLMGLIILFLGVFFTKWVIKPKEFRVQYQKLENSELVTEYTPGLEDVGLDSDVTA